MAELHAGAQAHRPVPSKSLGTLANWLGAAISVALIVGVGVWGYRLLVRDVSGVPVVRAAEGPMRVQPTDPGGSPAAHQGLAVNTVAAVGTAAAPADRLVLAPRPVDLTAEDAPAGQLAAAPQPDTVPQIEPAPQSQAEAGDPQAETEAQTASAVDTLVAQLINGASPLSAVEEAETPEVKTALAEPKTEAAPKPRPQSGLARSLRPQLRPAKLGTQLASAGAVPAAALVGGQDVDPASIPVGTRLAQLGAYDSPDVARREWDRLNARFGDYMDGKDRVIQRAQSGGRTFYRLRAMGFADLADARRFCAAFVAEKADCIPVVTR